MKKYIQAQFQISLQDKELAVKIADAQGLSFSSFIRTITKNAINQFLVENVGGEQIPE